MERRGSWSLNTGVHPGVKRPEREVEHSPPSNTEVKNERSLTSSPLVCLPIGAGTSLPFLLIFFLRHSSWPRKPKLVAMSACLPWGGSNAVSHVADLRGMSKNPGFTWKSKSQAKLTGHFSPVIPSFADRGLSCRLHVEAPRGESGNV